MDHAVNDDEGERGHGHFPRAFHTSPPGAIGEGIQRIEILVNRIGDTLRRRRVFFSDVFKDANQVFGRGR
jgi:hypothetical protein